MKTILDPCNKIQNPVAQLIASLTADPGIASSIQAWAHSFMKIGLEVISTVILLLPLIQEGFCQLQGKVCAWSTG